MIIATFFIIACLSSSVSAAPAVNDETEAIVTPLDVKPSEVQIVQRHPRSAYYYGGYGGFKYAPVLPVYGYPRYYSPYYGKF